MGKREQEKTYWYKKLSVNLLIKLMKTCGRTENRLKRSFLAGNPSSAQNVMTYMPDFWGTIIRQQREHSERNKRATIDALISSGGSIRDKYAMLCKQIMERRQYAELGSATGVYKTLMKYLVGVPEVPLTVESINSYIAWDFSLAQGKMNLDRASPTPKHFAEEKDDCQKIAIFSY
ncbi:hypothetical protein DH2020_048145 [Rehmannia glutinosa]|uniref:Uncharacterized protein n=1 Tax=Rehmannia glutinosa TaxID=99300 RepID=A0ABR0U6P8_REHGL